MSFNFDEYEEHDHVATPMEAVREWAYNCGGDPSRIKSQWLLHDFDAWVRNPHYTGPAQRHPEDECYDDCDPIEGAPPAAADTPFQAAVCRDLQELRRLGTLRLADYQRAVKIVRKNEGNTYAEHSCMSVTEAADLAADLARLAGNVT